LKLDPIYLRCYAHTHGWKSDYTSEFRIIPKANPTIDLVLDAYSTHDELKNLVCGTCGIWVNQRLARIYVFYNDDTNESEIAKIRKICSDYPAIIIPRKEFVETVFFPYVLKARAKCIGFELPYIISRLAIDDTESRRKPNGFSFTLSKRARFPHVIIKSIDSKSEFIEFTKTFRKKFRSKINYFRGFFADCKTFGFCLTNNSYDLESALSDFDCPVKLIKSKKQGIISEQNIKASIGNLLAIYSLYRQLQKRYEIFCLDKEENQLFSPASIGKAYLEKIGIVSFLKQNLNFPKEILGFVMSTYFGARVEARFVNIPTLVTILDFVSMYPTLFVLFGMYSLLIAEKISFHNTAESTQEFLDKVTISDINNPELFPKMLTICKIAPDEDILPVRSDYDKKITTSIATNYLKSFDGTGLWYTAPDLVASKLLTGKTPRILEAITFIPQGVQAGLRDIEILDGVRLKQGEDLFKKLIEQRFAIKEKLKNLDGKEKKQLEQIQKILKIIANSSAYGIFIQLNTRKTILKKKVTVYGLDSFDTETFKVENPAQFFNPIISVFLTAGSRLILAAVEHLLEKNNGYMVYCDTDAVFISPEHAKLIKEFFNPLNPYSTNVELFRVQEENGKKLENVTCLAFSSKRYVLYDYDKGKITIHKYSNHALGHLEGIDHEEFWRDIILVYYHPEKEQEILSKYEIKYAFSELTITNYGLLKSFDGVNHGKPYSQRIKPYNSILVGNAFRKDPQTGIPIVPFVPKIDENYDEIPFRSFVDKSGKTYPNSDSLDTSHYWKVMSKVFSEYRGHRETKLDGTEGVLKRKYLVFGKESVKYVGKETHDLEESTVFGASKEDSVTYVNYQEELHEKIERLTEEQAKLLEIPRRTYFDLKKKAKNGKFKPSQKTINRLKICTT